MSKQRNPSLSASPARRARGGRGFRRRPVGLGAITATLLLGSALALAVPATQATAQSEARQKIWLWADNEPGTGDLPGLNEDAFDLSQGYSPHEGRGYATFYVRTDQAHWACADITVEESGSSNKAAASDFTTKVWENELVGGSSYSSTRFEVPVADDTSREGPERFVAKLDSVSRAYKIRPGDGQADYPACVQPSTDRCNIPTVQRPCWDYYTTAIPEKSVPWRPTPVPDPPEPDPLPIDLPLNEGASSVDVWIADNDGAHFTMSGPTSITEGESATFRVTVSNKKSGTNMEVRWRLVETGRSNSAHVFQSASTTDDFTGATGNVLADFMYNNQTREFTVTTDDDGDDEHNEDIYVRLIGFSDEGPIPIYGGDKDATRIRNTHSHTLRIIDNDDPIMRIQTVHGSRTISEAAPNANAAFSVQMARNPDSQVSVQFQTTSASTATAGQDFKSTAGFIVFRPNPNSDWPTATITYTSPTPRTEQFIPDSVQYFPTITVPVLNDSDHEQDEAIELELQDSLTGPASLLAGQSSARAIIVSDDPLPVITVKAVTATISESDGQAEFSAQITRNPWREVKLAFRTIPTTATVGKRNCDSYGENNYLIPDYKETRGTIEFQPNPNSHPNLQWPTATIKYTHPTSRTETFTPTISQSFPTITVGLCPDKANEAEANETIKLELDVIVDLDDLDDPAKNFPLTDLAELERAPAEVTIEDGGGGGGTVPTPIDPLECLEDPMPNCPEPQQDAGDPDPDPPIEVPVQNNQGAGDPDPPIEVPVQDNQDADDPDPDPPIEVPVQNNRGAGGSSQGTPAAQQAGRAAADLGLAEAGVHADAIKELHELGVLDDTECAAGGFCWNQPISRETAAVWIVRVLDGGDDEVTAGSTRFTDVDAASPWAGHIERLADLEVTIGCSTDPLRFCPNDPVTREQMAAFLVRAFDLAAADSAGFEDTVGSIFETDIDALYAAGVTLGCSTDPLLYCPHTSTTRAEMASFLNRARNLN